MLPTSRAVSSTGPGAQAASVSATAEEDLQLTIHRFKQMFPLPSFMQDGPTKPLGTKLANFFETALQLANENDAIYQNTVRRLASDEGLERIRELIDTVHDVKTQQGKAHIWNSYLRPFFLTLSKQKQSPALESALRIIHNFLRGPDSDQLKTMYGVICDVAEAWKAPPDDSGRAYPGELIDLSSVILKQILDAAPSDTSHTDLSIVVRRLQKLANDLRGGQHSVSIDNTRENLQHVHKLLGKGKKDPAGATKNCITSDFDLQSGLDPPGTLSMHGPRHNNDHANIADISIFPTTDEILAPRPPYLPLYDPSSWHVDGFQGLVDRHFRLLREDNLGSVRDVMRSYLHDSTYSASMNVGKNIRINEYKVQSMKIVYDRTDGFELHVSVQQPTEAARRRTPAHREQWWVETRSLDWETLVCIVFHGHAVFCEVSRATCRTFAQLLEKQDKPRKTRTRKYDPNKNLFAARDYAYFVLQPADPQQRDIEFMLKAQSISTEGMITVEFPTILLASFRPLLSTLQRMSGNAQVPLSDILVSNVGQSAEIDGIEVHVPPPLYAKQNFQFDLRPLTKNSTSLSYSVRSEPDIKEVCLKTSLDEGQAKALLNALRRRLALIQGPPGTGKSFTGEAIIEVLLANKAKANLGPIICICQTNHALDQLLEHLYLRKGIKRIVRLGSRSKSAAISELTLLKLMDARPPPIHELISIRKLIDARRKAAGKVIRALEELGKADPHECQEHMKTIRGLHVSFQARAEAVEDGWAESKAQILRRNDIIGVTTSGLSRFRRILSRVKSKVVLCEEAGEVLESHTLAALMPHIQHLILIGDHQQLRPATNMWDLQVANSDGKPHAFDISLFERLVKPLLPTARKLPFDTLNTQRRMHPMISNLIRSISYPRLCDAENVEKYPPLAGFKRRLFWFHHMKPEEGSNPDRRHQFSFTNRFEIEVIKTVLGHLNRQNAYGDGDIAVLTPYAGQLQQLRIQLGTTYDVTMNDLDTAELEKHDIIVNARASSGRKHIRVATVDNFQGEEALVVIISLVRSNPARKCGFLNQENRVNVLLSRAKHGMIIIGNAETYSPDNTWWKIIQMMQADGNLGSSFELSCPRHVGKTILASTSQQFVSGSCTETCGKLLICGHNCNAVCHPHAPHTVSRCSNRCEATLPCGHGCIQICHHGRSCAPCSDSRCDGIATPTTNKPVPLWLSHSQVETTKPINQDSGYKVSTVEVSPGSLNIAKTENKAVNLTNETFPHVAGELTKLDIGICTSLVKLISSSHSRLVAFELRLLDEQESLRGSLDVTANLDSVIKLFEKGDSLAIRGKPFPMIQTVHNCVSGRYNSGVSLVAEVNNYLRRVRTEEEHLQKLFNMRDTRQQRDDGGLNGPTCPIRMQCILSGTVLLIRCNFVILADFVKLRLKSKVQHRRVSIDLAGFRLLCQFIAAWARELCYPRHEAEAYILLAKMIILNREVSLPHAGPEDTTAVKLYLQAALDLVVKHQCLTYLIEDIEAVYNEFSGSTFQNIPSSHEKRFTWTSYANEFQDRGYWHVCANGHPFSIEDQTDRTITCPECDAPAGEHGLHWDDALADEDGPTYYQDGAEPKANREETESSLDERPSQDSTVIEL
jgi:hypothetical protein